MTATPASVDPGKHCFGSNLNTSAIHDNAILLGQVAFWDDTAMTFTEIDSQYGLLKQIMDH
ncbi:hypothetical protein IDM30_14250 [Acinetobacter seifertii]|nr:hypothetical protein [Acinetobacter seifertii]